MTLEQALQLATPGFTDIRIAVAATKDHHFLALRNRDGSIEVLKRGGGARLDHRPEEVLTLDWRPAPNAEGRSPDTPLAFEELRLTNHRRTSECYDPLDSWSLLDWTGALAAEVGQLAVLARRVRRGETVPSEALKRELGAVVIYCDLIAQAAGFFLQEAVRDEFNSKGEELGSGERL